MKHGHIRIAALAALAAGAAVAMAQTEFTYQGQLKSAGVLADGSFDLTFRLWDADMGGSQIGGAVVVNDEPIINGLLTAQLDFGVGAFDGDPRWLEIAVRPGASGGGYTTLSPRQPLTAVPYALYAMGGATSGFWAANGANIYKTNTGDVGIGTNSPEAPLEVRGSSDSRLRISHISGAPFAVPGPAILELKSNLVLGDWPYGAIDFIDGSDALRASIEYGPAFGIPGPEGMRMEVEGQTRFLISTATGNVGIGSPVAPQSTLHVMTDSLGLPAGPLYEDDIVVEDTDAVVGLYSSNVGTRGSNISLAEVDGSGALVDKWAIGRNTTGSGSALYVKYGTSANYSTNATQMVIESDGDVGIGTSSPAAKLHVNGTARVNILEVMGADVAERFPISTCEPVEPGTVMAIDPANPGKLCVARGAYNRCVAGIVSGAGDTPVGAILGNLPGLSADSPPIALSGRVWVRCDARERAIAPGDLLTTSDTPGCAMAVADSSRATGAVLGKAMTSLERGDDGLVLVLVGLQ